MLAGKIEGDRGATLYNWHKEEKVEWKALPNRCLLPPLLHQPHQTLQTAGPPGSDTARSSEGLALEDFPSEERPRYSPQVSPVPGVLLRSVLLVSDRSSHRVKLDQPPAPVLFPTLPIIVPVL